MIGMNGHSLVLASTHGTEGVRAKERSAQCPAGSDEAEGGLAEERDAASRTSAPRSGSSASFAGAAQACSGAATSTPARWSRVGPGRAAPCGRGAPPSPLRTSHAWRAAVTSRRRAGSLVTFSSLLEGSGLSEARGLRCPTYKKQKERSRPRIQTRPSSSAPRMGIRCTTRPPTHPPGPIGSSTARRSRPGCSAASCTAACTLPTTTPCWSPAGSSRGSRAAGRKPMSRKRRRSTHAAVARERKGNVD
ncbi:unnamed protein product [Prorocentrum cordatum]|uniref:Uncharacterized protein n=1 Tax=Prorocentrum cordatum TaxID=2364126 RepID=A0ABN9PUA7_9DINO|nr:unnamed protein product [Polarella glacialis]